MEKEEDPSQKGLAVYTSTDYARTVEWCGAKLQSRDMPPHGMRLIRRNHHGS